MSDQDITVDVAADPHLLTSVRGMIRSYVGSFGFESERAEEIVLAVDEACANAIRHAYGGPCDKKYHLTMRSTKVWVEIELRDGGKPVPAKALDIAKDTKPADLEDIVPGGLGIPLIFGVFDKVEFEPGKTRGNCVRMKLKRPNAESA